MSKHKENPPFSTQKSKKVVILLPTYNEKENLEGFIKEIFAQEKNSPGWNYEILVVDSHSPDGTLEIAKSLAKKDKRIHVLAVERGLGIALIEGHRYSIKNFHPDGLAQMDADGQVNVDVLPRLLHTLDQGYDLALGSRFVKGGKNLLSPSRRLFSLGLSIVSRILMGPINVGEFANSARAFTPELFNKINIDRLPWREQTFIIQPAFLNEAVIAGAKYKEIPLVFKNRAEGYSKNKVFNYSYDVLTYSLDAFVHRLGLNIPIFKISRRSKTFLKFGMVGLLGTFVDFFFYKLLINSMHLTPATAKGFSTEVGIINNFIFNNFWTFRARKVSTNIYQRFFIYNLVCFGGLAIAVLVVKFLHHMYGDGFVMIFGKPIAYNNFYFFATIPPVMAWNFTVNHFVTWKHKED